MRKIIDSKFELGILLCLFATQFARIIIEITESSLDMSTIFIVAGLLIAIDWEKTINLKIPGFNKSMIALAVYQIFVLINYLIIGQYAASGAFDIMFTIFSLVFIIGISTNSAEKFNGERFVRIGWLLTGVSSVILLYLVTEGLTTFSAVSFLKMGSDRLTLSVIAYAHLIFTLLYNKNSVFKKGMGGLFIVSAIISVILCSRKGILVSYIIILIMHYIRNGKRLVGKKIIFSSAILIVFIIIIANVAQRSDHEIFQQLNQFIDAFSSAIKGYFGQEEGMYNTGAIRRDSANLMWNEYRNSFSFMEYVFGKGYAYRQIDFPYFEAFIELGLLGGIFYLVLQLILPIKFVLVKTNDIGKIFVQYYTIVIIAQNIYSGVPYGYSKFVPIAVLFLLLGTNKQKNDNKESILKKIKRGVN